MTIYLHPTQGAGAAAVGVSAETQMLDKRSVPVSRNFGHWRRSLEHVPILARFTQSRGERGRKRALATPYATPVVLNVALCRSGGKTFIPKSVYAHAGKSSKRRDASSRSRTIAHERQRWLLHHH